MKKIFLDVMLSGRFYRQLAYEYCPLWAITPEEVEAHILKHFPWLKGKRFTVSFSTQGL